MSTLIPAFDANGASPESACEDDCTFAHDIEQARVRADEAVFRDLHVLLERSHAHATDLADAMEGCGLAQPHDYMRAPEDDPVHKVTSELLLILVSGPLSERKRKRAIKLARALAGHNENVRKGVSRWKRAAESIASLAHTARDILRVAESVRELDRKAQRRVKEDWGMERI